MSQPSPKLIKKLFKEIVSWVRSKGCKVYCCYTTKTVSGSNGYFTPDPQPHIKLGLKSRPWASCIALLIHELCHFWQWKNRFLDRKDDEGNLIYAKILKGEEITPEERDIAKKYVAISEYDCEKRTAYLLKKWKLEPIITVQDLKRSSNTYNRHIAWSIGSKFKPGSGIFFAKYDKCAKALWGNKEPRWLTMQEILAPISQKHSEIFDKATKRKNSKN